MVGGTGGSGEYEPPDSDNGDNGTTDDSGNWFDRFTNWFSSLGQGISQIGDKLTTLPTLIANAVVNGIKGIFIPDAALIQNKFEYLLTQLEDKFGFNTSFFDGLFGDAEQIEDVDGKYYIYGIGNLQLKFLDTRWLIYGVEKFRKYIRGFIILLLAFYHIKQVLSFIRQDAGVVAGKMNDGNGG